MGLQDALQKFVEIIKQKEEIPALIREKNAQVEEIVKRYSHVDVTVSQVEDVYARKNEIATLQQRHSELKNSLENTLKIISDYIKLVPLGIITVSKEDSGLAIDLKITTYSNQLVINNKMVSTSNVPNWSQYLT